jgi:acetyltransferase EpsM
MPELIIVGAGGHSKVVTDAAIRAGFRIKGFLDDYAISAPLPGYDIIGTISDFVHNPKLYRDQSIIIAIGSNHARMDVVKKLKLPEKRYAIVMDPSAVISRYATIAKGTVILQGAVVNAGTVIGKHVILNTGCTVDHDCEIANYVHISPGANLAGGVAIQEGAHLGIGSCVIPKCSVGKWSSIGAGAAVIKNIPPNCTAVGVPAKIIKSP